jgi:anti-sigma regulatory factor (Ser/Thr protein kinase)
VTEAATVKLGFRHEALLYADPNEFLAGAVPFVQQGLAAGEAIMVALPRANRERLGAALGEDRERVLFATMEDLGRNPARIIPAWRDFLDDRGEGGRGVRGIGEPIWPGRTAAELDECERHESLLNLAFAAGRPWSLMCPYDTGHLSQAVLRESEHNHPLVCRHGCAAASDSYLAPEARSPLDGRLAPAPNEAEEMRFTLETLCELRRFVDERARSHGLDPARVDDFVLAAGELANNSLRHGGGRGTLRIWRAADVVVCEAGDAGRIDRPLVGRERPRSDQTSGRGLWLANQLCDLLQVRSGSSGTTVRMRMSLSGSGSAAPA